jgi:hypothetical protein
VRGRDRVARASEPASGRRGSGQDFERFAARRWKRSTRPPVSTSFCLPV